MKTPFTWSTIYDETQHENKITLFIYIFLVLTIVDRLVCFGNILKIGAYWRIAWISFEFTFTLEYKFFKQGLGKKWFLILYEL